MIILNSSSIDLRRYISNGLLLAAAFRKPPTDQLTIQDKDNIIYKNSGQILGYADHITNTDSGTVPSLQTIVMTESNSIISLKFGKIANNNFFNFFKNKSKTFNLLKLLFFD